ncbi:MAG: SAM-dependent methyltransferase [Trebonia sp.]
MPGGKDNYAADRAAAEAWREIDPDIVFGARANRAFLGRAVRYLTAAAGIRQFLDIGTGIPTAGNTHQVAQAIAPESRVVYVDYDPVVLAHARALLISGEEGATEYIDADLRDTPAILTQASRLLDFTRPVAITLMAVLHAIPDADDPYGIVATLMDAVPSGSYLALSHSASDLLEVEQRQGLSDVTSRMIQQQFTYRSREQVARFFAGTDLVEPGLVRVEEWRPDPGPTGAGKSHLWSAVSRKRLGQEGRLQPRSRPAWRASARCLRVWAWRTHNPAQAARATSASLILKVRRSVVLRNLELLQ